MKRLFDNFGRIYISQNWLQYCTDTTAVISIDKGCLIIQPYNPQKHDPKEQLCRKLDDRARVKIPPDILKAVGFTIGEEYHLYIAHDNTVLLRKKGSYCDVCGKETEVKPVLGRSLCQCCFDYLKRSE